MSAVSVIVFSLMLTPVSLTFASMLSAVCLISDDDFAKSLQAVAIVPRSICGIFIQHLPPTSAPTKFNMNAYTVPMFQVDAKWYSNRFHSVVSEPSVLIVFDENRNVGGVTIVPSPFMYMENVSSVSFATFPSSANAVFTSANIIA